MLLGLTARRTVLCRVVLCALLCSPVCPLCVPCVSPVCPLCAPWTHLGCEQLPHRTSEAGVGCVLAPRVVLGKPTRHNPCHVPRVLLCSSSRSRGGEGGRSHRFKTRTGGSVGVAASRTYTECRASQVVFTRASDVTISPELSECLNISNTARGLRPN
jgi:hypothetical protein